MDIQINAWGSPLKQEVNEFVLPKTLAETFSKDAPPISRITIGKDEIRMDLIRLRDQSNQAFHIIAQFTEHHNLGLAMNKIAGIIDSISELMKKYE